MIVGLDWETALLDERLTQRTDKMFADGLVGEVDAVGPACARESPRRGRWGMPR